MQVFSRLFFNKLGLFNINYNTTVDKTAFIECENIIKVCFSKM